jgi:bifunctional non-homologous end joining protein LigD
MLVGPFASEKCEANMAKSDNAERIEVGGHEVRISSPAKPYFTRDVKLSKMDIVRYFLAVAPGALRGIAGRPIVLKRFVNGAEAEPFYQKRAPTDLPTWMRTVTLSFPSGRTAEEVVVDDAAGLAWIVNLGCMELHPHAVTADDLEHPNELRVDLDPGPGVGWSDVREVAMVTRAVLEEHGLMGWPKTSGSRGMHVNARIEPLWSFTEVRRAALALAREVERRVPALASSKWWKEERHGVFLDYNQNAKDRTTSAAYSVRPLPDARVSAPLRWDEVMTCDPGAFTVLTMPARFAEVGDLQAGMSLPEAVGSLEGLLELAARDEARGLMDAPWPPHFAKGEGEGKRVAPSRAKKAFGDQIGEGFGGKRFRGRTKGNVGAGEKQVLPVGQDDKSLEDVADDASLEGETDSRFPSGMTERKAKAHVVRKGRVSKDPLLIVAQSSDKAAVEAGLERWKAAHAEAAALMAVDDVLVDRMRGSAYVWYRIRVNLRHVPEGMRPAQDVPDPDDDPTRKWREDADPLRG